MIPSETYVLKELLVVIHWYELFFGAGGAIFVALLIYGVIIGTVRFFNYQNWSTRTRIELIVGIFFICVILGLSIQFIVLSIQGVYRIAKSTESPDNQQKPIGILASVEMLSPSTPTWLSDHERWLEDEGKSSKQAGKISNFTVRYYKFVMPGNTLRFIINFKPIGNDFAIWCRAAYRSLANVKEPSVGLSYVQPLPIWKAVDDKRGCQVSVPESRNGDVVLVIMRVDSKAELPSDLTDVVSYSIK